MKRTASSKRKSSKQGVKIPRSLKGFVRTTGAYGRFNGTALEQKFYNITMADESTGPLALNGAYGQVIGTQMLELQSGTGPQQRVGRKVRITHVDVVAGIQTQLVTATPYNKVIMRLWLDKQCNGQFPTADAIYDSNIGDAVLGTQAPWNLFNEGRFVLLGETSHTFNTLTQANWAITNNALGTNNAAQFTNAPSEVWTGRISCPVSCTIEYSGTNGDVTEIRSNNIYVEFCSDFADVSTVFRGFTRIRYVDA